jgi:hypothetical protein
MTGRGPAFVARRTGPPPGTGTSSTASPSGDRVARDPLRERRDGAASSEGDSIETFSRQQATISPVSARAARSRSGWAVQASAARAGAAFFEERLHAVLVRAEAQHARHAA